MKSCSRCRVEKALTDFTRNCTEADGYNHQCRECRRHGATVYRANNGELIRQRDLAKWPGRAAQHNANRRAVRHRKHGLSDEEYASLRLDQGGECAFAGCHETKLEIDHDHGHCPGKVGCRLCVRGLVCRRHNTFLPYRTAAELDGIEQYLTAYRKRIQVWDGSTKTTTRTASLKGSNCRKARASLDSTPALVT